MWKNTYSRTGLLSLIFAVFLFFVGIPYGITSPSNVSKVILSPTFWPQILSVFLALTGLGLIFTAKLANEDPSRRCDPPKGCYLRLGLMAGLMVLYVLVIPKIGLVWASMVAFYGLAMLIRTPHYIGAPVSAILVPLLLYAFFAHVAGVAIPQGDFVRLP